MSRIDKLRKKKNDVIKNAREDMKELNSLVDEFNRVADVAKNSHYIISNIDAEFEQVTGLDKKDITFLFFAVALQCARWCLQPKIDIDFQKISRENRHDANKDGAKEVKERRKLSKEAAEDEIKSRKYPSCSKIWLLPVPYDAMKGTEHVWIPGVKDLGVQLTGANHHSATVGHDPVLGYIFGPINILTRTITFKNPGFQTCEVHLNRATYENQANRSGQYVSANISLVDLIERCYETCGEDPKRIKAAVGRHILHLESDKFCRDGLPIPFVSAETAQKLVDSDWNSYELERLIKFAANDLAVVGVQAFISMIINIIIETLHTFTYDPNCGISKELYEVKTRKILSYSNVIATGSNLIASAIFTSVGATTGNVEMVKKSVEGIDFGGLLVTIYRLVNDGSFIEQVKEEFLANKFYDIVMG